MNKIYPTFQEITEQLKEIINEKPIKLVPKSKKDNNKTDILNKIVEYDSNDMNKEYQELFIKTLKNYLTK